jgi:hypothetical protein
MSDSTGLVVISFLGVVGYYVFFYVSKIANDTGDQIALGYLEGRPIPTQQRWLMLYNTWTSYAVGAAVLGVFLGLAQLRLADYVADAQVKGLAYLAAAIAAFGTFMWFLQGVAMFFNYRSVLKQAELQIER